MTTSFGSTPVGAAASNSSPHCDNDAVDNGKGNLGDPGDGGSHHNEDNGQGNLGDPGNGANHDCSA
jgi:hypothetical protein